MWPPPNATKTQQADANTIGGPQTQLAASVGRGLRRALEPEKCSVAKHKCIYTWPSNKNGNATCKLHAEGTMGGRREGLTTKTIGSGICAVRRIFHRNHRNYPSSQTRLGRRGAPRRRENLHRFQVFTNISRFFFWNATGPPSSFGMETQRFRSLGLVETLCFVVYSVGRKKNGTKVDGTGRNEPPFSGPSCPKYPSIFLLIDAAARTSTNREARTHFQ